jgi:cell division transport system ATP-binding protein
MNMVVQDSPTQGKIPFITLDHVTKMYANGSLGLSEVNLNLNRGQFLFVTGASGAGKSTFLKLLYGAERPSRGRVVINNQDVGQLKGDRLARFRRRVGVIFQDYKLLSQRTVAENVSFVLWAQGYSQAAIDARLLPTLKLVGLKHKAQCFPPQLSGGEQQRVSIARAIVGTPPLLLADEPTGNLDPDNSQQIMEILEHLHRVGVTIVLTTHDAGLVRRFPHPVVQIRHGKMKWLRQ